MKTEHFFSFIAKLFRRCFLSVKKSWIKIQEEYFIYFYLGELKTFAEEKPNKMYNVYWYRSYTRIFCPIFSFPPVLIQCH